MRPPAIPAVDPQFYRALKDDIARRGIVVPLVYDQAGRLLDGLLRLKIAEELGLRDIPSQVIGGLTREEGQDLRLVLNGLRRQLTRDQLREVIRWTLLRYPEESDRSIAARVGTSHHTVSKMRGGQSAQPEKRTGRDGKQYPARKPIVFTHTPAGRREATQAMTRIGDRLPPGHHSLRKVRKTMSQHERDERHRSAGATLPDAFDLRCGDFRRVLQDVEDGIADLIYGDPPWHDRKFPREDFAAEIVRLLRPGGTLAIYTGDANLLAWADTLRQAGLKYLWTVMGLNANKDPDSRFPRHSGAIRTNGQFYSCKRVIAIFQRPGPLRWGSILHDVIPAPDHATCKEDGFEWSQPLSEALELVRVLTKPGDLVCDLTFGSGTSAVAVAKCGQGRRFLGAEVHVGRVKLAESRVEAALEPVEV